MLILLPPSEGKAATGAGDPVDLAALSLPGLTLARERVLESLVSLCAGDDPEPARSVLGLSPGQVGEVHRNAGLRTAAAAPAGEVYTGVLYDALDLASLGPDGYDLVVRSVLVFSGLWGAVRLDDRITPYRCAVGVKLPGLGALGGHWKGVMGPVLADAAGDGPVLDLRSGAYAAMWTPRGELAARTAAVRVVHERVVDGAVKRSVVSHFNKATKGRLVRDLATTGAAPDTVDDLVTALRELAYTVEERPAAAGAPRQLDVVVTEL
ncbi:peroxide stress protein YaaA [Planosporangium sp. 12N6]|uniref:peroxide stress protein YaaA n=1 Tax=Planosporangium spinosum TaxID=3402278 RepID=UPI003CF727DB